MDSRRSIEIHKIHSAHSRYEVVDVLESGLLHPDDASSLMTPEEMFYYRWSIAYSASRTQSFSYLERYLLSMYGKECLDSPELTKVFYEDIETRARNVGKIALFAHTNTKLAGNPMDITVSVLGESSKYDRPDRLSAQSANFNNTMGLSGLVKLKIEDYQRVIMDEDGQVDSLYSVLSNTRRLSPFLVEHIQLHKDLSIIKTRRDIAIGMEEIEEWTVGHPSYKSVIEGTVYVVKHRTTNPVSDFPIPQNKGLYSDLHLLKYLWITSDLSIILFDSTYTTTQFPSIV